MGQRGATVEPSSGDTMSRLFFIAWLAMLLSGLAGPPASAQVPGPAAPLETSPEAAELYLQIHQVLTHPRCLNCHPKGDSPKQGDQRSIHTPPITRGPHDDGPLGLQCAACHQQANYAVVGVPGAPNWHLAPISMAWEDKTPGEVCRALLDPRTNGNRDLKAIVTHLTQDELVAWGWEPGIGIDRNPREPVPIAKAEFNRIVRAWARGGAACPD
jgi:hypothetical protein